MTYQDYINHGRIRQWRRKWYRRFGIWPRGNIVAPINDESNSPTHNSRQVPKSLRQQIQ